MEAKASNFGFIRDEKELIIPFFQRPYVWEEEQWEQFFNDLKNSFDEETEHFFGSIIIKRQTGVEGGSLVIDGQQRLTTFSLLLKGLYDELNDEQRQFFKFYLFENYTQDAPKILHSELDREKYTAILQNKPPKEGKLIDCFNYFKERIEKTFQESQEKIFEFIKYIVEQKLWVVVALTEKEDEQQIFDSINSTGQRLTATDIIKNALFAVIIGKLGENKAKNLYAKYWNDIFEKDDKQASFWNEELETGRVKRVRSEILLHSFSLIKGIFNAEKHNLSNLSNLFKNYINSNLKHEKDITAFLEDLHKYARIYYDFPWNKKGVNFSYKKWEEHWKHIGIDDEKAGSLINQIGNMTLLKQKLNTNIANSEWKTKLHGHEKKQGIKNHTDLLITKELLDYDEWNAKTIEARTKKLTEEFLTIWDVRILQKD